MKPENPKLPLPSLLPALPSVPGAAPAPLDGGPTGGIPSREATPVASKADGGRGGISGDV